MASNSVDKEFEVAQWKIDLVRSFFNNPKQSGLSGSKSKLLVECAEKNMASAGCEDETIKTSQEEHVVKEHPNRKAALVG